MTESGIIIKVRVSPIIREFYMCVNNGSDVLVCTNRDSLNEKIKYLLKLPPKDYSNIDKFEAILQIKLADFHILNRRVFIDYRNYLSDAGNRVVFNELNSSFKKILHNYVAAYVSSRGLSSGSQKAAIIDFCEFYNLSLTKINYEMLKKSWDRSKEKKDVEAHLFRKNTIKNNSKLIKKISSFVPCN